MLQINYKVQIVSMYLFETSVCIIRSVMNVWMNFVTVSVPRCHLKILRFF